MNPAITSSGGGRISTGPAAAASGTCASERYSAKRTADRRSTAHPSIARKARPEGCGRQVPRSNQPDAGAIERVLEQAEILGGRAEKHRHLVERNPCRASSRIRRAISTHSRPSPGAEKSRTSPRGSRSGGWRVEKSERRNAVKSESPAGSGVSIGTPSVLRRSSVARSPNGTVINASGTAAINRVANVYSSAESSGTSSNSNGNRENESAASHAARKISDRPAADAEPK